MSAIAKESVYEINQQGFFNNYDLGFRALHNQAKMCNKLYNSDPNYNGILAVLSLSQYHSANVQRKKVMTGRPGRPGYEYVPINPQKPFMHFVHIHMYVAGLYAASFAKEFCEKRKKIYYRNAAKNNIEAVPHAFSYEKRKDWKGDEMNFIPVAYMEKQSLAQRIIGQKDDLEKHRQWETAYYAQNEEEFDLFSFDNWGTETL